MKVYLVIDRVSHDVDGVYLKEEDAQAHVAGFLNSEFYEMEVEEHRVKESLYDNV